MNRSIDDGMRHSGLLPTKQEKIDEKERAALLAECKRQREQIAALREALEGCVYSLAWHHEQGHLVGMDEKHLKLATGALNSLGEK